MEEIRNPKTVSIRYHYMDNLRALAMMLGVFFHAALCYCPGIKELWPTCAPESSYILDHIAKITHLFRMPLFFLIAGFFSYYLVNKRGIKGFIRNRSTRILLPFVIFWPIVIASLLAIVIYNATHIENKNILMQIIAASINGNPINTDTLPRQGISTTHLWFLYYLVLFYIMILILYWLKISDFRKVFSRIPPKGFLLFFPLLLVPALITQSVPHPAPESAVPAFWPFGFHGIFFLIGWYLYNNIDLVDTMQPYWKPMLGFSIIGYAVFYTLLPEPITSLEELLKNASQTVDINWQLVTAVLLEAYIAIYMTFLCLIGGKKLLDKENAYLRLIADSSYWVYIIHLPLIFLFDSCLLDTDINLWIKYSISSFGTILIGLISYVMFVRWTPIGWMLNGRRSPVITLFRQSQLV